MTVQHHAICLHGLAKKSSQMSSMQHFMEDKNICVHNLSYPSTQQDLSGLAAQLISAIKECVPHNAPTHFIGFSLGGLLLRLILTHYRPPQMGRVVQIAPPNQGSDLVDHIKHWRIFRAFFGPAGQALDTQFERIAHLFGPIDYELGVIAATQRYDWSVCWAFDSPHDGRVSVARTKVQGM